MIIKPKNKYLNSIRLAVKQARSKSIEVNEIHLERNEAIGLWDEWVLSYDNQDEWQHLYIANCAILTTESRSHLRSVSDNGPRHRIGLINDNYTATVRFDDGTLLNSWLDGQTHIFYENNIALRVKSKPLPDTSRFKRLLTKVR